MQLKGFVAALMFLGVVAQADPMPDNKLGADKKAAKEACRDDVKKAGCSNGDGHKVVACMRAYKQAHPDFRASDQCRAATVKMRHDLKKAHASSPSQDE